MHRQIAALLADLRAADAAQPWTVPTDLPTVPPTAAASEATAAPDLEPTE